MLQVAEQFPLYKRYHNFWPLKQQLTRILDNKRGHMAAAQKANKASASADKWKVDSVEDEELPRRKKAKVR